MHGTVVVSGALANKHRNGGEAWVRLSWILGLRRLGFDVWFVEQMDTATSVDAAGAQAPFAESENRRYFEQVVERFGLDERASLLFEGGREASGVPLADLLPVAEDARLLVNISGHLDLEPLMSRFRRKAYVDLDPGFTQFWHADGTGGSRLEGHDVYFTVGESIGTPACEIPTCGLDWKAVRPPVVLEEWPVAEDGAPDRFTTVGAWRGAFGPVSFNERTYSLKVHEFRKVIELPRRAPQRFEIALDIHPGDDRDRTALEEHGWHIVDPRARVPGPHEFREYVQGSGAEFSVAQGIYVETGSGWFSDRTVRYLASGRPALVQDTGFSAHLPTGEGLLAFSDLESAVAGAERIAADYGAHREAARAVAESHFDSDMVLTRFLDEAGLAP
jgi:hypothetical protein